MSLPDWLQETIAHQIRMNRETWAALQAHGVDEDTELKLDFFYFAPGETEAQKLAAFLYDETDYDVEAKPPSGDVQSWMVVGTTQPTTLTPGILDEWVQWMVVAGARNGGCEFDGWGAEVPS
jgi:hypothetical protein